MRKNTWKVLCITLAIVALFLAACSKKGEGGAQAPAKAGATPPATAPEQAAQPPAGTEKQPAGETPGTTAEVPTPPAPPAPKITLVEFPPVETPAAAGPAYLVVNRVGLVKLDEGKFTSIKAPEENIKLVAVAPDGTVWAVGYRGLYKLQGDRLGKISGRSDSADQLAIGPQGDVWLADFEGLAHFDGTAWMKEEKSVLGADVTLIEGLAVDAAGKPWAISPNAIHSREADGWKTADLSALGADRKFFEGVAAGPGGEIYAAEMNGLVARDKDGKWATVSLGDDTLGWGSASEVAINAGRVVLAFNLGELVGLLPDGKLVQRQWGDEPKGDFLRAMALDGAGRIWIASDAGLAVIAPGGETVRFAPGTIPEAPGRIDEIAVAGGGPVLPTPGEARTGTVTGKIRKAGQPLAGAKMEICASPATMFQETPCTDAPFRATTTTDETGGFKFENVPIFTYGFSVEVDGKWATSFLEDCCEGMQPGQEFDAGTYDLD